MNISGSVVSGYYTPHVYFIFAKDVLYVGETQHIPVRRWSSHLASNGSFMKKLKRYLQGGNEREYIASLAFYSFGCKEALAAIQRDYSGYRIPTQALEHKIHEIVQTECSFGGEIKLLSETNKTAPRFFSHWEDVEKIARKAINKTQLILTDNTL